MRGWRLSDLGWTILRFWNDDVLRDTDNVCQHIVIVAGLGGPQSGAPAPVHGVPSSMPDVSPAI